MNLKWIAIAAVTLAAGTAFIVQPADARTKRVKQKIVRCVDRPQTFSWSGIFFNPAPEPNGCAPAVYAFGRYVGQDPDPNIRAQLLRDPRTGYAPF
jgi:hypothetical protein